MIPIGYCLKTEIMLMYIKVLAIGGLYFIYFNCGNPFIIIFSLIIVFNVNIKFKITVYFGLFIFRGQIIT